MTSINIRNHKPPRIDSSTNIILCIDLLLPVLDSLKFSDSIMMLSVRSNKKNTIIPTLSLLKKSNQKTIIFSSISEILTQIGADLDIENDYSKIICAIDSSNYSYESSVNKKVLLLFKNKKDLKYIKRMSTLFYSIRQKSINLLNDSLQLADRNRKELMTQMTVDICQMTDHFARFITEKYKINTFPMEFDQDKNSYVCKQECPLEIVQICNKYNIAEHDKEKPIAKTIETHCYIIYPFASTLIKRDVKYILVLDSLNGIPSYVLTNLRYFLNYYFAVYLEKEKNNLIQTLYDKILKLPDIVGKRIEENYSINIQKIIPDFIEPAFDMVLSTTNAFSASFRMYNPAKKSLELVVAKNTNEVRNQAVNNKHIYITDKANSMVLSTFLSTKKEERYDPDIHSQSKNYLNHRENTKTELCYCIFFKDVAIGTLNFESSIVNAFVNDKSYLKKIRTMLEGFLAFFYESNDKQWMARRSQQYENQHELKNLIKTGHIPENIRTFLAELVTEQNISMSTRSVNLKALSKYRKDYIKKYKDDLDYFPSNLSLIKNEMVENFSHGIKVQITNNNLFIADYKLNMIKIIFKNLLDNYRKHSDIERDSVYVNFNEEDRTLVIMSRSSRKLKKDLVNKLLNESIGANLKKHDGLFIVGMLTRHLNGYAYAYNDSYTSCSKILVKIPLGEDT